MSKQFRVICKVLYRYYDYQGQYEFTLKPLNYHNKQKIKFNLRIAHVLFSSDNCLCVEFDKVTFECNNILIRRFSKYYILDNVRFVKTWHLNMTKYKITLELRDYKLISIPPIIYNLKSLKHLDLSYNKIINILPSIGKLKSLEYLNISCNRLINIPTSIGKLKLLKKLDLHGNQITELPASVCNLESLEDLNVFDNKLTNLPASIGNLKQLRHFVVAINQLTELPASINKLESLIDIHLDYNQLTEEYISYIRSLLPKKCLVNY